MRIYNQEVYLRMPIWDKGHLHDVNDIYIHFGVVNPSAGGRAARRVCDCYGAICEMRKKDAHLLAL